MAEQLANFLNDLVSPAHVWKVKLFENWGAIIGNLRDKARIERIENKLLVIGVIHPAWAQELFLLSDIIKNRINSFLGKEYIKDIRFKTVVFKNKNDKPKKAFTNKHKVFRRTCLTQFESRTLSSIKDEELKKSLKEFCFRCKGE